MARTRAHKGIDQPGLAAPGPVIKDWHAMLIIAAIAGIFFRDILLQKAFFWEDFIYQYYAFRNFAAVSLAQGTIPLWNPYTFGGMPFQADIQTALFYLPNLLLTLFVSGGRLHFFWVELMIILHFVIAGVSMYYFVKELGLERVYALFSAVAFLLSGFLIVHVIHQTFVSQVAWTPLVLLLVRRTLLRKSILSMVLAGLTLGHAVLAGSPQFTLYIFLLVFFYFLFEWIGAARTQGWSASLPMLPLAAGVVILAVALTAIQLLPTMELAPLSKRATISFENSAEGSLHWEQIVTLVAPKYFGARGAVENSYMFQQEYWGYWETCIYVGVLPLMMAGLSLLLIKKNRYVAFFAGILSFGFFYCLGKNFYLHSFFFHLVPGFDKFRDPGRMSFFFTFAAAILSGFGLRFAVEHLGANSRNVRKFLIIAATGGVLVFLLAEAGAFQTIGSSPLAPGIHANAVQAATTSLGLFLGACVLLFLVIRRRAVTTMAILALVAFHCIDMNIFGFDHNNGRTSPEQYYNRPKRIVDALKEEGTREYFRVNSREGGYMLLDRNQGMVDRVFLLEGYTPLVLRRVYPPAKTLEQTYDLLNARYRIIVNQKDGTMGLRTASNYLPRAFIVYGDTVVHGEAAAQAFMESDSFDPRKTVVYEESPAVVLGTSHSDTAGSAVITEYDLNSMTLSATTARNGILVMSERYYPGWHAYVDGIELPLVEADWCLRAIPISAGTHEVVVRFEPESFSRGVSITLLALAMAVAIVAVSFIRKRRTPAPVPT